MSLPEPYYQDDAVTLYCADCREIAPALGNRLAVVADPPYGMGFDTDMTRFSGGTFPDGRGKDWGMPVHGDSEPFDPSPWLIYPNVILWGVNHFADRVPRGTWLMWVKKPPSRYETFLSDAEVAWMKGGHGVYLRHVPWEGCANKRGLNFSAHPTQKPIEVMSWCISKTSDESTILDPFAGSGTTLVAAKRLGRKAIGIEIEERYCAIAVRRLAQEVLL